MNLVRVGKAAHARHDTEDVVVGRVDTDLGGLGARNGRVREDKLKGSVVNAREVARARRLVLLRAKGERVDVDARVRGAGVRLERLDKVEVGALTLREAVLAVKLELGGDDRVLAPAVHVKSRLGEDEGARIRNRRATSADARRPTELAARSRSVEGVGLGSNINSTGVLEETRSVDERVGGRRGRHVTTERHDGVRESIDGVGVIERLGAKGLVEHAVSLKRGAVVNILVRLDDPDKLLARVVEVELNLVGRRTDRLIAGELELLDEVLVRVLGHAAALVGVKEDVVNVERGGNKRLVVSLGNLGGTGAIRVEAADSPEALVNRAEVEVNLDLVVLEGDERKRKARVAAVPELERHVESGLREGVARGADLLGGIRVARTVNVGEVGVGEVGKLGGVANHLVVTTLLLLGEGELVPDVHPVAVLAVNALATNLNLNGLDKLLSREI